LSYIIREQEIDQYSFTKNNLAWNNKKNEEIEKIKVVFSNRQFVEDIIFKLVRDRERQTMKDNNIRYKGNEKRFEKAKIEQNSHEDCDYVFENNERIKKSNMNQEFDFYFIIIEEIR